MASQRSKDLLGDTIPHGDITPEAVFRDRRRLMQMAGALGAGALLPAGAFAETAAPGNTGAQKLAAQSNPAYRLSDALTPYKDVTTYNNFYEFGTDKSDPARNAHTLQTRPWQVTVEGAVAHPGVYDIDALLKLAPLEERVYRMRCVEGWSMVIPWIGYPLADLIKRVGPTGNAKYVQFLTLDDPKQMPGLSSPIIQWPYTEGLRMDEAMNPLTLLTMGLYGEVLPKQDGAPVRVVVPWKYGFKSAKSIVRIRFVDAQPPTSWNRYAPSEYGFYSNVNPQVDHPRWSQATERRIGEGGLFTPKRPTLMYNGYGAQVASLYTGMDLRKNY
ncbi:protein-methionine-sulfoxide reductase catalytic subunit MsrP [Robbsia sp. Bb-Pol-6]|uniref:Protein-methionine-sulfoxide reductase catalytic subunit MsrP n=1 Tax=Robbsia betulipollinis TaxID=2981849 RepID=A0ABT3ZQ12_9BURK|nr:protein-methionine-sulfoxide reductase catalytic subunit MsrP [Robbsia betulipollinis]MCY0388320.1 protein-methionine-sulfoxide reductase catalytic subunit MsrP [Robbsia betulipollinis]